MPSNATSGLNRFLLAIALACLCPGPHKQFDKPCRCNELGDMKCGVAAETLSTPSAASRMATTRIFRTPTGERYVPLSEVAGGAGAALTNSAEGVAAIASARAADQAEEELYRDKVRMRRFLAFDSIFPLRCQAST